MTGALVDGSLFTVVGGSFVALFVVECVAVKSPPLLLCLATFRGYVFK